MRVSGPLRHCVPAHDLPAPLPVAPTGLGVEDFPDVLHPEIALRYVHLDVAARGQAVAVLAGLAAPNRGVPRPLVGLGHLLVDDALLFPGLEGPDMVMSVEHYVHAVLHQDLVHRLGPPGAHCVELPFQRTRLLGWCITAPLIVRDVLGPPTGLGQVVDEDELVVGVAVLQGFAQPAVLGRPQSVVPTRRAAEMVLLTFKIFGVVACCGVPKKIQSNKQCISPFKCIPVVHLSNKWVVFVISGVEVVWLRLVENGPAGARAGCGHVAPLSVGRRTVVVHVEAVLPLVVPAHEEERHRCQVWHVQRPLVQLDGQPFLVGGVLVVPFVVEVEVANVEVEVRAPGCSSSHCLGDHLWAVRVTPDFRVTFNCECEACAS
mmetsp:Transcript_66344/g.151758  ORF Transcript_66344/g.151758 Transcript_66344/m.151758 type:complete len:375 (+) Transcript_66344:164-1288(+)